MFTVVGKSILSGENKSGQPFSYNKLFCVTDVPTSNYTMSKSEGQYVTTLNVVSKLFDEIPVGATFSSVFYDREGYVALVSD